MNAYEQLVATLDSLKEDADKFYNHGNDAAGTRLRLGLLKVGKQTKSGREDVQAIRQKRHAETPTT